MKNIAIFASGNGTNAEKIISYFQSSPVARVTLLLSDNPSAPALEKANNLGVDAFTFFADDLADGSVLNILEMSAIDYVVLAGFLKLIPNNITARYKNRILNIHPSLLPKFGGKGMYGDNVHKAVIKAGEKESGITIHHVDMDYDSGSIVFQKTVTIAENETPESLAEKIHELEYKYYPEIIEKEIKNAPSTNF